MKRLLVLLCTLALLPVAPATVSPAAAQTVEKPTELLLFDSNRSGSRDVFLLDAATDTRLTTVARAGEVDASYSTAAGRVVFASCGSDTECNMLGSRLPLISDSRLYSMALDGSEVEQLPFSNRPDTQPEISPDGKQVAFVRYRDGDFDVYVAPLNPLNGEPVRRTPPGGLITADPETEAAAAGNDDDEAPVGGPTATVTSQVLPADVDPSWSLSGEKIAYASNRNGGVSQIFVMPAVDDGIPHSQLTTGTSHARYPTWSPDGKKIAFARDGDLWVLDVESTEVYRLTETSQKETQPAWSPSGDWIAFAAKDDADYDIYAMKPEPGSPAIKLTENAAADNRPAWVAKPLGFNADATSVPASPRGVRLSQLPLQPGAPNADPQTAPLITDSLGLAPLITDSLGLAPLNFDSLGIAPINFDSLGLAPLSFDSLGISPLNFDSLGIAPLVLEGLKRISIASLPLVPPNSWEDLLARYTTEPVHNLSLADVYALVPQEDRDDVFGAISLAHIDLTLPPFSSANYISLLLGNTPIGQIAATTDAGEVTPEGYWCQTLAALGYDCAGVGGLDATLLDLQISGVPFSASPSIQLQRFRVGGTTPAAGAPINAVKLSAFNMATLIGSTPVGEAPDAVECEPECATLYEASQQDKLAAGATFADLVAAPTVQAMTWGDVLYGLLGDYPLHTVPFSGIEQNVGGWRGEGASAIRYTVDVPAGELIKFAGAELKLRLPKSFRFDFISTRDLSSPGLRAPEETPAPEGVVLTWPVNDLRTAGVSKIVAVARPGFELGPQGAAALWFEKDGVTTPIGDPAPVSVVDSFTGNNTPATAAPIGRDILYFSFSGEGEDDFFKLPAPPAGSMIDVTVAHQNGVDRDLLVYHPPGAPLAEPLNSVDTAKPVQSVLPDDPVAFDNSHKPLQPELANDVPLVAELTLAGYSQQPDDRPEFVRTTSAGGSGDYVIQVSPYLGASGSEPYTLIVRATPPPALGPCQEDGDDLFPHNAGSTGSMPQLAADTTALVLFNESRTRRVFGDAATAQIRQKLGDLATAGKTQILGIDGVPAVQAAYAEWDADLCSPTLSNRVVRAINDAVEAVVGDNREQIEHVLIIGDHYVIPNGFIADPTWWGNERSWAQALVKASGRRHDARISAAAHGLLPTDNPYGDYDPIPVVGGYSYRPRWALGRLVATASQITGAIDRYLATPDAVGKLDIATAAVLGTDFMTDAAATTASDLGSKATAQLIGDGWTKSEVSQAIAGKDLVGIGAHFDHSRLLAPGPAPSGSLFGATDLTADVGKVWWTMGCHSGTNLRNVPDWADGLFEKSVDVYFAQLGYGLGSKSTVALSEEILVEFNRNILAGHSAGQSLLKGQRDFVAANGVLGAYEEKALHQAIVYGIPMASTLGADQATPLPPGDGSAVTELGGGVDEAGAYAEYEVKPKFRLFVAEDGSRIYSVDGGSGAPQNRPILPTIRFPVAAADGLQASGWTIEALSTADQTGVRAATAQALLASGGVEPPSSVFGDVDFPAVQARLTPDQRLAFVPARFSGDLNSGTLRLMTRTVLRVYRCSVDRVDRMPPTFTSADVNVQGGEGSHEVTFRASVQDDTTVERVSVLFRDETGLWMQAVLQPDGATAESDDWIAGPIAFSGPGIEATYFAVDGSCNTAFTSAKGSNFGETPIVQPAAYDFQGLFPPGSSGIKAGRTYPVKFEVFEKDGGEEISDTWVVADIGTEEKVDGAYRRLRTEDLGRLVYDDGQFKFEWSTDKSWAGKTVRLVIKLIDGAEYRSDQYQAR